LQDLAQKRTTRREHFACEIGGGFSQRHDAQMVGLAMPGGIRRHIGEHNVCSRLDHCCAAAAEQRFKTLRG